jgi:hypothetical protein
MKTFIFALVLIGGNACAEPLSYSTFLPAAPVPVAARQSVFTATDWSISAGVFLTHAGDYLSTEQGLREPTRFRETVLPSGLAHSHFGLAAYEASTAALEIYGAYLLTKHGHRRLARVIQGANISLTARTVASNYQLDWTAPNLSDPHLRPFPGVGSR